MPCVMVVNAATIRARRSRVVHPVGGVWVAACFLSLGYAAPTCGLSPPQSRSGSLSARTEGPTADRLLASRRDGRDRRRAIEDDTPDVRPIG
jgi:hypothetical protein